MPDPCPGDMTFSIQTALLPADDPELSNTMAITHVSASQSESKSQLKCDLSGTVDRALYS